MADSPLIGDAVATQDTVTQLRSATRRVRRVLRPDLAAAVRAVLERDDDYVTPGKPACHSILAIELAAPVFREQHLTMISQQAGRTGSRRDACR